MTEVCIVEGRICRRRSRFPLLPLTLEHTGERVWLERVVVWELLDRRGRWHAWCVSDPSDVVPPVPSPLALKGEAK